MLLYTLSPVYKEKKEKKKEEENLSDVVEIN